ncbi:hypothetical protein C7P88_13750 [Staphylococcus aureus]|nr:hypothetical protein C7P88_13750 [Staphylococcus aureus]
MLRIDTISSATVIDLRSLFGFFFFQQETAFGFIPSLVGSEMGISNILLCLFFIRDPSEISLKIKQTENFRKLKRV